ncbi:hypothetical protein VTL71DRAFT_3031 [Oculimacula yallundae]|uniref:Uncharacterized protein n=1 Tax=Oculimacula yallundae TaxID=86028 RepID=A0ABR4C753_9HELO
MAGNRRNSKRASALESSDDDHPTKKPRNGKQRKATPQQPNNGDPFSSDNESVTLANSKSNKRKAKPGRPKKKIQGPVPKSRNGLRVKNNKTRGSSDDEEDDEDDESPAIVQLVRERYQAEFDDSWTRDDEDALQSNWSKKDEAVLQAIDEADITLWRKSLKLFQTSPPDLLPAGDYIDTSNNRTIPYSSVKGGIKNTNWSHEVCQWFGTLMSCPVFVNRPDILTYAIEVAMYYRLGDDVRTKPDRLQLEGDRTNTLFEAIMGKFDFTDEGWRDIPRIIQGIIGEDYPPHMSFLDVLEQSVKMEPRGNPGVQRKDMLSICDAWDYWAELPAHVLELKHIKEYAAVHARNKRGVSRSDVLELKKSWILSERREKLRANEGNPSDDQGEEEEDEEEEDEEEEERDEEENQDSDPSESRPSPKRPTTSHLQKAHHPKNKDSSSAQVKKGVQLGSTFPGRIEGSKLQVQIPAYQSEMSDGSHSHGIIASRKESADSNAQINLPRESSSKPRTNTSRHITSQRGLNDGNVNQLKPAVQDTPVPEVGSSLTWPKSWTSDTIFRLDYLTGGQAPSIFDFERQPNTTQVLTMKTDNDDNWPDEFLENHPEYDNNTWKLGKAVE